MGAQNLDIYYEDNSIILDGNSCYIGDQFGVFELNNSSTVLVSQHKCYVGEFKPSDHCSDLECILNQDTNSLNDSLESENKLSWSNRPTLEDRLRKNPLVFSRLFESFSAFVSVLPNIESISGNVNQAMESGQKAEHDIKETEALEDIVHSSLGQKDHLDPGFAYENIKKLENVEQIFGGIKETSDNIVKSQEAISDAAKDIDEYNALNEIINDATNKKEKIEKLELYEEKIKIEYEIINKINGFIDNVCDETFNYIEKSTYVDKGLRLSQSLIYLQAFVHDPLSASHILGAEFVKELVISQDEDHLNLSIVEKPLDLLISLLRANMVYKVKEDVFKPWIQGVKSLSGSSMFGGVLWRGIYFPLLFGVNNMLEKPQIGDIVAKKAIEVFRDSNVTLQTEVNTTIQCLIPDVISTITLEEVQFIDEGVYLSSITKGVVTLTKEWYILGEKFDVSKLLKNSLSIARWIFCLKYLFPNFRSNVKDFRSATLCSKSIEIAINLFHQYK